MGSKQDVSEEMGNVMRDAFTFLHKNYLEFESKKDASPALLNLLQLTHNNLLDINVSVQAEDIQSLT